MIFEELSDKIICCAIEVHKTLGPGLLESTYEQCLAHEFKNSGINFKIQYPIPINYKGLKLNCGYRIDLIVEDKIIFELKSIEDLMPIHEAQLLTYMKLANIKVGLLINFNNKRLTSGIKRFVL